MNPQNNRDLNQGLLHLWFKFGDPSLNGCWVIVRTNLMTDRRTQATTISGGQHWPRVKSSPSNVVGAPVCTTIRMSGEFTPIPYAWVAKSNGIRLVLDNMSSAVIVLICKKKAVQYNHELTCWYSHIHVAPLAQRMLINVVSTDDYFDFFEIRRK